MKKRHGVKSLSVLLATMLFLASSMGVGNLPYARAAAPAIDLIISEYIEGSSNNKAIELFNGTPNTVDLSAYLVELYSNGATTPGNTVTLSGTLDSGSVYVIANASAATGILDKKNITSTVTYFNGDDAFVLKHNGNVIDSFGQVGFDPGMAWGSGTFTTLDHTLVRKSSVTAGDSNSSDAFDPTVEWDVYDKDTFTFLGSHTMDGFGGGEPQDTIKPVITHTPLTSAPAGSSLDITCQATDNIVVSAVKLYYRIKGQTQFSSLNMGLADGLYKATVPKEGVTVAGLEYYLEASDGTNVATAPEDYTVPYEVSVLDIDTAGPEVSGLTPANGASTSENVRPVISAQYSDCSGINASSVALYLDTLAIPGEKLTVSETGVTYTPDTDLSLGKHTARLVVSDNSPALNQTEVTWDFYVGQVEYNLYFGGLHSHTNLSDGTGTPDDAYTWARDEAKVDFLAITDHSNSFDNDTDYTKSTEWKFLRETADKYNDPGKFVAIGAYEMTWSGSTGGWGHINTFNTDWFETRNHSTMDLKAYYALLAQNPQSISQLNHPGPTFGDFADFGYYTPAADQVVNLIEVGNGEGAVRSSGYFPSYDFYTRALDKGWHLAPTNNQDNHKGKWGNANTARTVVLAPSLTRENVYDAMHKMRVYATEDENLQIKYTVNGQQMGSFLNNPAQLNISIDLNDPDATDKIGKVSLIVDGGKVADSKTFDTNTATWDLTLDPQYTYYYVRVDEADRDIAVTAPVWTGEVVPVGISKVEVSQDPQIVNRPVDITATVYNNGTTALSNVLVEFYKNAVAPENKIGEQTITTVNPAGMEYAKISWTPTEPGNYKLYAQAVIPVNGTDKSFTASTTLDAANEADLVKVVIDGGHQNQYVSGDYPGKIVTLTAMLKAKKIMLVQNPDELTAEDLQNAKALIITDPQSKDNAAKNLTKSNFTDAEIQVIRDFVDNGGSLIITSRADYDDKTIPDPSYESSKQGNRVLNAIGSNLQLNDDEVIDNTSNGGLNYRLYFDDYTSAKYHLTDNIPSTETYSAYSGCSVISKAGGNTDAVDWLVKGHDTTETMDSDLQGDATPVSKGDVNALAAEVLPNGSRVIVAGTTFFSDFETAAVDNAYSNAKITDNIINWVTEPKPAVLKTIAEVRADADQDGVPDLLGQRFAVEGRVTAESVGVGSTNAFFDVIYVQDATGGLTIFGVSNRVIPLGAKVRITGKVGQYEGDSQIQISNENTDVDVLDATPLLVEPKVLSTAETMDERNEGWLVKTEGEVKRIGSGNGDNSLYIDDNSGEAKVYLNGYIGDGTTNPDALGRWDSAINVGDRVSVIGLASQDAAGHRIRVRNTREIVRINSGHQGNDTSPPPPTPTPGPVNGVWEIKPTQQQTAQAAANQNISVMQGGVVSTQDGTMVVLPRNVVNADVELKVSVAIGKIGTVPQEATLTMFDPVLTQREFTASVNQFQSPVTVTLPYKGVNLAGLKPSQLAVFWWNPQTSKWVKIGGVVDSIHQTVSVPVYHFSTYAVIADISQVPDRLAGYDRYETAISVAEQGWGSGADSVVLVNAQASADALAGTPLAFKLNAPILLTDTEILTSSTATELKKLGAKNIVILGGTTVVSQSIEDQLVKDGYSVSRYGGLDRYETAKLIAGALGSPSQLILASGKEENAVDAVAISSWAAHHGVPILFTEFENLPTATNDVINRLNATTCYVVGGTSVVSDSILKQVNGIRVAGLDRYETAATIASRLSMNPTQIYVTTGLTTVDALVAGNLAAKTNSPILFVDTNVPTSTFNYIQSHKQGIENITIVGGEVVVTSGQADALHGILKP